MFKGLREQHSCVAIRECSIVWREKTDIVRELLTNDIEKIIEKSSWQYTFYGADAQRTSDGGFRKCYGE